MFRVVTCNVNGIRSAARKGFFDWLSAQNADVVCLQETKAQMKTLNDALFRPEGYHCHFVDAEKKGYSGVGIYSRRAPKVIVETLGWDCADKEGRYVQFDYAGLSVVSLYMPSGSSGDARQAMKFEFMERYRPILKEQARQPYIICGDWNIVHKRIDIKNWSSNQKHSGCLPEERAWLDGLFTEFGFVDAFRVLNHKSGEYTWWSNRGQARQNNVGWRIDYQIISNTLADKVKHVSVYRDERFSDHAPLIIDYAIDNTFF